MVQESRGTRSLVVQESRGIILYRKSRGTRVSWSQESHVVGSVVVPEYSYYRSTVVNLIMHAGPGGVEPAVSEDGRTVHHATPVSCVRADVNFHRIAWT